MRLALTLSCLALLLPPCASAQPEPDTPARTGAPDTPVRVPPPVIAPVRPLAMPSLAPAPPAVEMPRPAAITSCDTSGCWDSNSRRLNSQGPLLLGPRGPCLQQGGLVSCP
ncbi:hypothetical protein [Caenimonas aquaedulcis]|uniref:Uncharacterized protein n=1 Tax=Caenimonas aquaedulcis TaxID=2793270 RepID=A0A931H1U1_9BURK|nr:hypothetical protein [Caenimonas aquaedulcis]MBG9387026.1 hypothetical protein [Caenimonas aquaedulcis]